MHPPRRRVVGLCMICRRLMFFRRERFCDPCFQDARRLAAELDATD
jgi:hypothetical protein